MRYKAKRDIKFFDGKLVHRVSAGQVFDAEDVPDERLDTNSVEKVERVEPLKPKTKKKFSEGD